MVSVLEKIRSAVSDFFFGKKPASTKGDSSKKKDTKKDSNKKSVKEINPKGKKILDSKLDVLGGKDFLDSKLDKLDKK